MALASAMVLWLGVAPPVEGEGAEGPPASNDEASSEEASSEGATSEEGSSEEARVERDATFRMPRIPRVGKVQPWVRLTSWTEYYGENFDGIEGNEGFVALVNRLSLGQDARLPKGVSLGTSVRLDTQNLFYPEGDPCDLDGNGVRDEAEASLCRFGDDYRLERATLRVDSKHVSAVIGDTNVQWGKGVPLSVRNVSQIGVDATIKGGRLKVRGGPISFDAIAGYANRANSDFTTRQLVPDPGYPDECDVRDNPPIGNPGWTICSDLIAGGRLEARLPGRVDLATNYAYVGFGEQISDGFNESMHIAGGDIGRKRVGGVWDVFLGGTASVRMRDSPEFDAPDLEGVDYVGRAIYLSNAFLFGKTTLVVEGKHYEDYLVAVQPTRIQYSSAPSLEREDQQVPGNFSATGGRARLAHTFGESGVTLFVNGMGYVFAEAIEEDQFSAEDGLVATHGYGGAIWHGKKGRTVQVSTGYRHEWHRDDGRFRRKFPHLEFYVNAPFASGRGLTHSASFRVEGRFETKQVTGFANEEFVFGTAILGYAMAPYLQLSLLGGMSTEFPAAEEVVDVTGEPCDEGDRCKPHLWPGAEVRLSLANDNFIRVFVGRQVGGRICVNGSCRVLPDFEGVRAELVLSF